MVRSVVVCPGCGKELERRNGSVVCTACGASGAAPGEDVAGLVGDACLTPPGAPATVTATRFIHGGLTIPVATITSYRRTRAGPDRGLDAVLALVAVLAGAAAAVVAILESVMLLGILGVLLGTVGVVWLLRRRPGHGLVVTGAPGVETTVQGDKAGIGTVHDALDHAIVRAHAPARS